MNKQFIKNAVGKIYDMRPNSYDVGGFIYPKLLYNSLLIYEKFHHQSELGCTREVQEYNFTRALPEHAIANNVGINTGFKT